MNMHWRSPFGMALVAVYGMVVLAQALVFLACPLETSWMCANFVEQGSWSLRMFQPFWLNLGIVAVGNGLLFYGLGFGLDRLLAGRAVSQVGVGVVAVYTGLVVIDCLKVALPYGDEYVFNVFTLFMPWWFWGWLYLRWERGLALPTSAFFASFLVSLMLTLAGLYGLGYGLQRMWRMLSGRSLLRV